MFKGGQVKNNKYLGTILGIKTSRCMLLCADPKSTYIIYIPGIMLTDGHQKFLGLHISNYLVIQTRIWY